jgi:hypothetical protein
MTSLLAVLFLGVVLGLAAAPYIKAGQGDVEKNGIRFETSRDTIPLTAEQLDALEDGGH